MSVYVISPESALRLSVIIFISVDFPEPFGPSNAYIPGSSSAVNLFSARLFPYDFEIYELLFALTYKYDLSVANMAEYFGFENELAQYYENDFKDESWENITTYIKNNNFCEKSKLFEDFLKNKHLMNNDNTWNTRLIQAFNIDHLYKEAKEMYEYLKQLDKERY